jgi:hypothetical protein
VAFGSRAAGGSEKITPGRRACGSRCVIYAVFTPREQAFTLRVEDDLRMTGAAMIASAFLRRRHGLPWLAALVLSWAAASALAQQAGPGRAAYVSWREGSVVFAPRGDDEWIDLPANRPLAAGDRVWTDQGARAELQLGTATLHVDGESHLGISALDETAAQFILQQGHANARVRDLQAGENFEIDTPNLAFRATEPGDYRIDVAADGSATRVAVRSGSAQVFGENGQALRIAAGEQASFGGRTLAPAPSPRAWTDAFDRWAEDRNRLEDASLSARYLPPGVVGSAGLDRYGSWDQDPEFGAVWFPSGLADDWAPYRYGHWETIQPWGWTWVDDAPWGFAPFHYGRWTTIGGRWAWVPGRLPRRPAYLPAQERHRDAPAPRHLREDTRDGAWPGRRDEHFDREAPRERRLPRPQGALPSVQAAPPVRAWERGEGRDDRRALPPSVREQLRAQHEQDRLQREAERQAREQIRRQEQQRRAAPQFRNGAPDVQDVAPPVRNVAPQVRNVAPQVRNVAPHAPAQVQQVVPDDDGPPRGGHGRWRRDD